MKQALSILDLTHLARLWTPGKCSFKNKSLLMRSRLTGFPIGWLMTSRWRATILAGCLVWWKETKTNSPWKTTPYRSQPWNKCSLLLPKDRSRLKSQFKKFWRTDRIGKNDSPESYSITIERFRSILSNFSPYNFSVFPFFLVSMKHELIRQESANKLRKLKSISH